MKYFLWIGILLFLFNCSPLKNSKKDKAIAKPVKTNYKFKLSSQSKLFFQDLKKELAGEDFDKYSPSSKIQKNYNLIEREGGFVISGFITTDSTFNKKDLFDIKIQLNSSSQNISTIVIPLKSVFKFLEIDGIQYFELTQKTHLKKH